MYANEKPNTNSYTSRNLAVDKNEQNPNKERIPYCVSKATRAYTKTNSWGNDMAFVEKFKWQQR